MAKVLIVGCGYVGIALGKKLHAEGDEVWGLRRNTAALPEEIIPLQADLLNTKSLEKIPTDFDQVIFLNSAASRTEEAYREAYIDAANNLIDALTRSRFAAQSCDVSARANKIVERKPPCLKFIFVSSTAVYGQYKGEFVDENSITQPESFTGKILLLAEEQVLQKMPEAVVVRFGGIYGPNRVQTIRRVSSGEAKLRKDPVYTNRIHRDDCAGALAHILKLQTPERVYLGVDCNPADLNEVYSWIAEQLKVQLEIEDDCQTKKARFSDSNKRCMNTRLLASGYQFIYPSYKEGFSAEILPLSTFDGST